MAEFDHLRKLLRDRQKKAGALGTFTARVCIDTELIADLRALESERRTLLDVAAALKPRASGAAPTPDTSEIDARIDEKNEEIAAQTLEMVFRSLSSVNYQRIVNAHPDTQRDNGDIDNERWALFANELAGECLFEVRLGGELVSDPVWSDIADMITFGEWEPITMAVLALNRRRVDVPLSSRPSTKTQ
jgi:hypothetical protein